MRFAPLATVAILALSACGTAMTVPGTTPTAAGLLEAQAACTLKTGKPFYRVFRGMKRADVASAAFIKELGDHFIPAAPETHGGKGLVAYVPAIPPANKPTGLADEFAIVVYQSEEIYKVRRETPEGKAYADMHWTIFDKPTSKSDGAAPFDGTLKPEVPVDLLERATDWQCGHTTFFIGKRKEGVTAGGFLSRLSRHVAQAKTAFTAHGLQGYIVVATNDSEVAFMNWTSAKVMEKGQETPAAKAIVADAATFMETVQWTDAKAFKGTIAPGQAVNVRFTK